MSKFYKLRRHIITAYQWLGIKDSIVVPFPNPGDSKCAICNTPLSEHGLCNRAENKSIVCPKDYIVRYPSGECLILSPSKFETMYEEHND